MTKRKTPATRGFIQIDKKTLSEIDYMDKLSPEERAWYQRFLENEYNAEFQKDGNDVLTDSQERKNAQNNKYHRMVDFTNQLNAEDGETCEEKGKQILSPKVKQQFKHKPERAKKYKEPRGWTVITTGKKSYALKKFNKDNSCEEYPENIEGKSLQELQELCILLNKK